MQIAIVIENQTYVKPMVSLAKAISTKCEFDPIIIMPYEFSGIEESIIYIEEVGISVRKESIRFKRFRRFLNGKYVAKILFRLQLQNFLLLALKYCSCWSFKKSVLVNSDLLILPSENLYCQSFFAKINMSLSKPTITVPNWFISTEDTYDVVKNNPAHQINNKYIFKILMRLRPELFWFDSSKEEYEKILPFTLPEIFFRLITKSMSPNPWLLHSGFATKILAESEGAKLKAIEYGLDADKLYVVGSIALDEMSEVLETRKPEFRKRVLLALPPNMHESRRNIIVELKTYEKLVKFLLEAIENIEDVEICISVHPSDQSALEFLTTNQLSYVINKSTHIAIANCDIFIACASSTLQWAVAANRDVINFDFYKYNWNAFRNDIRVIEVDNSQEFINKLNNLVKKESTGNELQSNPSWGILDGQSINRICNIIIELLEKKRPGKRKYFLSLYVL